MSEPDEQPPKTLDERAQEIADRIGIKAAPVVQHAETVNVDQQGTHMPYGKFIAAVTLLVIAGFSGVSLIVLLNAYDAVMKGSIISTWNNLAVAAVTFWVGSSIAGKLQAGPKQ